MDIESYINFIKSNFEYLINDFGFSNPEEVSQNNNSVLRYRKTDFGIDIEIEYFDYSLFILVVDIKNGLEPEGYYIENSNIVRKNIYKVLLENNLIENEELSKLQKLYFRLKKSDQAKIQDIVRDIVMTQSNVLKNHLESLIKNRYNIFQ